MAPAAINAALESVLAGRSWPAELEAQLHHVLAKGSRLLAEHPLWPVAALPRRALACVGAPEVLADGAAAVAMLFYGASDIIDDAQDDELGDVWTERWGGWPAAVNAGNGLLFLSGEALWALPADEPFKAAWARSFAIAGRELACGQALDFAARPDAPWSEEDVMRVARLKAGACWACLAEAAPLWSGRDDAPLWRAFGERLGMAYQLASDIWPYLLDAPHRDLALGKLTLPLFFARESAPEIALAWAAGELPEDAQRALRERVFATGAVMYAQMRVEVLKGEANELLAQIAGVPARESLAPLVAALSFAPGADA